MALPWFRLYSEFLDDPKVQMMPEHMRYRLVALMCSRCKEEPLTDKVFAHRWRVPLSDVEETKALFIEQGFIDAAWKLLNWEKRQPNSDASKDRTKRWRANKVVTVTDKRRSGDVLDVDKEVEGDKYAREAKSYF